MEGSPGAGSSFGGLRVERERLKWRLSHLAPSHRARAQAPEAEIVALGGGLKSEFHSRDMKHDKWQSSSIISRFARSVGAVIAVAGADSGLKSGAGCTNKQTNNQTHKQASERASGHGQQLAAPAT